MVIRIKTTGKFGVARFNREGGVGNADHKPKGEQSPWLSF
jgi:hypothetical protein